MTDAFAHQRQMRASDPTICADPAGTAVSGRARARPELLLHRGGLPAAGGRPNGANQGPAMAATARPVLTDDTPLHDARGLTSGGSQARILLDRQVYTLRITRQGKLILTK